MGNIFEYINKKNKRIFSSVKKSWRKLKYLDRTQLNYYIVTGFIGLFCMFTGITYAAFTLNINFGTIATIRIAKLSYTFSVDDSSDCTNCTVGEASDNYIPITIPANTTGMIDFKLVSKNKNFTHNNIVATTRTFDTKYAIDYSSTTGTVTDFASTDNVSIYYSQNYKYNMEGEIGPDGSIIVPLRAVIENESASSKTVYFTVIGGYLQNDISSNITEGYYETTEPIVRYVLLDERLGYVQNLNGAPTNTESTGYSYFRTVCTESDAIPVMNYTTGVMTLDNSGRTTNVSCDVYFKKQCSTSNANLCQDLEIYYSVTDRDGNETLSQTAPTNGELAYTGYTCGSGATITETWNSTNEKWTTTISNVDGPASCVINFKDGITLANYLISNVYRTQQSNADPVGNNAAGLYYHSSTCTNGCAQDGAYRYAGAGGISSEGGTYNAVNDQVNNWVCFGTSDASTCKSDTSLNNKSAYLYRIMGVYGDSVKLIKADSIGNYAWNSNARVYGGGNSPTPLSNNNNSYKLELLGSGDDNDWATQSTLKPIINDESDTRFLGKYTSEWKSKIEPSTWYIGGFSNNEVTPKVFYDAEFSGTCSSGTCPGTTLTNTKVGLMNVSEYGYSASSNYWNTNLKGYSGSARTYNWLYQGVSEWTMSPNTSNAFYAWFIYRAGSLDNSGGAYGVCAARPVFYLSSSVEYVSGSGTYADPYIIR